MKASGAATIAALLAALAFVFADQVRDDGFRSGHRGWVSAHTLAVAAKATADNGYVGYAIALSTPVSRDLYYFDRYPVFFASGLHALQGALADDKGSEIRVARQVMNVVHALTLLAATGLLVALGLGPPTAVAAVALAGAGFTMVEYRDMVHFDQPALLGMTLLLWAVANWYRGGTRAVVFAATAVAVLLGRGYASFAVLGLWWALHAGRTWLAGRGAGAWRTALFGLPTAACVLGFALGAGSLAYNVAQEARVRRVPLEDVSILRSAAERLSLDPVFNEQKGRRLGWAAFLSGQAQNLGRSAIPWTRREPLHGRPGLRAALGAAVLAVALGFALGRGPALRIPWLLACAAGPLWIVAMRNLSAFHPYTAVYFFPVLLVFFAALVHWLPARARTAVALLGCALLVLCTHGRNANLVLQGRGLRQATRDMEKVARHLAPGDAVAADGRVFRGVPFALGFYLPDHDIVVEGPASLVLTRDEDFEGELLTPGNSRVFLFRTAGGYRARSPLARLHRDSMAARSKTRQKRFREIRESRR